MDGINQTAMRDAHGRFVPGNSGNPAGKKPGTRNRATVLREALADGEDVAAARIVIDKALAGDAVAARFLLDRLTPRPRGRAIALDLPRGEKADDVLAASNATIAAMAAGEITPDEALTVTKVLDGRLRALKAAARGRSADRRAKQKSPSPLAGPSTNAQEGRGEGALSVAPTQLREPPHPPIAYAMGPPERLSKGLSRKGRGIDEPFRASLLHSACNLQFAAAPPFLTAGARAA
jgi:hypothetical protein